MLTERQARSLKAGGKPVHVGGVPGLYLRPGPKPGTGKFFLRFVSPETGKRRDMGLGTYPDTRIAIARIKAVEARGLCEKSIDPIEQATRERLAERASARATTFGEVAELVHADLSPSFKNAKHRAQWINTLRTYVCPSIGDMRVADLSTADFAKVLRPIWLPKPETASRVRQRCERVMTWCMARGLVPTNPVSAVEALLPRQPAKRDRVQHHPSVPWRDLPAICAQLFDAEDLPVGREALLFAILAAARSGEVRGATWQEFDLPTSTWIVPAQRMKAGARHRVPLSKQAMTVLTARKRFASESGFVFSRTGKKPVSDMTLSKILRDHAIASDVEGRNATAHGFRSSFRDWASELGYSRDLAEKALAHAVRNQTEAAYHRTDLLEQRRSMLQDWADHCTRSMRRQ